MKKSIIYLVAFFCLAFGFTSCEKQSEGKTRITYYAELTLKGDATMVVAKGSEFKDPGCTAIMKGEDVSDQIKVASNVNTAESGVYTVHYSIVNADGFEASTDRTVVVLNVESAIEGFWACTPESYRTNTNTGAVVAYGASFQFLIFDNGNGTYDVEDLLAGWYCQRAGYGEDYAMQARIAIDDKGAISLLGSYVPGWGDAADALSADAKYDAAANKITYTVTYAEYLDFTVELNKVEL